MEIQKTNSSAHLPSTYKIKTGKIFKHYSGKLYKIITVARDSTDPSRMDVVYQGLYDCPTYGRNPIWHASSAVFTQNVTIDGKKQPRFQEVHENPLSTQDIFHLGVKTILKNSCDKILVLKVEKSTKKYWDLPGGRVQINENLKTTARREVAEETAITKINNLHHLGMITSNIRIPIQHEQSVGLIFSFYSGSVENDSVILSSEHQDYEWVTTQKVLELLTPTYGKAFSKIIKAPYLD